MSEIPVTTAAPIRLATAEELNDLRKRVLAGEEFPAEEYRKIIAAYRANRLGAVAAAAPKAVARAAAGKKAAPVDLSTLLGGIGL
jgi:hypothetical protein